MERECVGLGVRLGREMCGEGVDRVWRRVSQVVEHLYTKLLNPEVGKLYSLITHNYGHHVQPVIYTMRATFLVTNLAPPILL